MGVAGMNSMDVLKQIYNIFQPEPLPAGSPLYVDCKAVRGGSNVLVELGKTVQMSDIPTCQLYTGHRGGGKSTELLRLQQDLNRKGCTVVYFSAEDEDVNPQDVEYTDILLACARHLLEDLKQAAQQSDATPVLDWLRDRAQALSEILQTQISIDPTQVELGIKEFAKITASIRTQPTQRAKLREQLTPHTETLVQALNSFIADAIRKLPANRNKLVLIADGLEKITLISRDNGRTNHDEIFIDRGEQLKSLNCHVIYTVPISLVLSDRASDLMEIYYCSPQVLPMVMVRRREGEVCPKGVEAIKQIIRSRLQSIDAVRDLKLAAEVFDSPETLEDLCLMSGGHVRNLILLVQTAIKYNEREQLPIEATALQQAIRQLRKTYRDTVNADQWALLAQVHRSKQIAHNAAYRSLLFTRCLLEYSEEDETWHDVHPMLREVSEFKQALAEWDRNQTEG